MPFFLILFLLIGAGWFYVSLRAYHCLGWFFKKAKYWPVLLCFCLFLLVALLGFSVKSLEFGPVAGYCVALIIYLLLFTLGADSVLLLLRLFGKRPGPFTLYRGVAGICVAALAVLTVIGGGINARTNRITEYDVSAEGKADFGSLKIAMISDLHLGSVGSESRPEGIVAEINAQSPDIVCIAGDFFDSSFDSIKDPDSAREALLKLNPKHGIYMCLGNHDAGATFEKMLSFAESCGIRVLKEEYAVIENRAIIIGRLDRSPIGGSGSLKRGELSAIMPENEGNLPIIVLDHNPGRIGEYENTEVDLVLCGHTHRGQMFPGSAVTNLMYEIDYGHLESTESTPDVIVSSGIGYWGMAVKVGSKSEIVVVTVS